MKLKNKKLLDAIDASTARWIALDIENGHLAVGSVFESPPEGPNYFTIFLPCSKSVWRSFLEFARQWGWMPLEN